MAGAYADVQLQNAWGHSFLAQFPAPLQERLLDGGHSVTVPAGAVLYREGDPAVWALVVAGLLRSYLSAADGRQITFRYSRSGDVLGMVTIFSQAPPASTQAVVASRVLYLDPGDMRELTADPNVAWILLEVMSTRLNDAAIEMAASAFGTVKERLARHLLDLAVARGPSLVVEVSHQQLADAVGSVREVVQRSLRELAREGVVRTTPSSVVVLDAQRLFAVARPRAIGD